MRVSFPFSFSSGPAFKVAHGGIGVNTGDLVGIGDGPIETIQAATAEADEGWFGVKSVAGCQFAVADVPSRHGGWATEHVAELHGNNVKPAMQQGDIGRGAVAEEFAMPDPWPAGRGRGGGDDGDWASVDFEIMPAKSIPLAGFAGEIEGSCRSQPPRFLVENFRLGFRFGEWQAGGEAGPQVTGVAEPGRAEQSLFFSDGLEDSWALRMIWGTIGGDL